MRPRERGREQSNIGDQALSSRRESSHGGGGAGFFPLQAPGKDSEHGSQARGEEGGYPGSAAHILTLGKQFHFSEPQLPL